MLFNRVCLQKEALVCIPLLAIIDSFEMLSPFFCFICSEMVLRKAGFEKQSVQVSVDLEIKGVKNSLGLTEL